MARNDNRQERGMAATRITVMNNGSLRVEGDVEIVDPQGNVFGLQGRTRISLCRCGQSSNKPFCDGSHKTCGFTSQVVAFDLPEPAPAPAPATAPATEPKPAT
jgi:CDGSH-type Zn-finger protein